MAKKRRRRRASLLTKGINIALLGLAFSRFIRHATTGGSMEGFLDLATAGIATGGFSQAKALDAYGPMLAAIVLKKVVSHLRRTMRV